MTTRYSSKCKAVKLWGNDKSAIYAVYLDGVRLDHLSLFVDRVYRNNRGSGGKFKGVYTKARVVDREKLSKMMAEGTHDIGEIERETALVEAYSLKDAMESCARSWQRRSRGYDAIRQHRQHLL